MSARDAQVAARFRASEKGLGGPDRYQLREDLRTASPDEYRALIRVEHAELEAARLERVQTAQRASDNLYADRPDVRLLYMTETYVVPLLERIATALERGQD